MMKDNIDIQRLKGWIDEIDTFNQTPGEGTTRPVYSKEDMEARTYVRKEMEKIGLEVSQDCAGNIYGVLPGRDRNLAPVWTGSHIDTVPNGGKFDGLAGVFSGMEALRVIRESGKRPLRDLSVNVYSGEEMSRYGACCIGSRSIVGRLRKSDLQSHVGPDGISLFQAMEQAGLHVENFEKEFPRKEPVYASLELHIEQNGKLEAAGIPVGIVTGICAPTNLEYEVTGVQSHAGGTSMKDRRDAYMAAAEISLLAERLARESDSPYITATVGDMRIEPGAANVIPGKAAFPLDIRSIRMEDKDKMLDGLRTGIKEIALERGVSVSESMMNHDKPVMCDPHLREIIRAAADQMKIPAMDIVSGPYHDSLMLGDITRVGMIFVPSRDGISHNRAEWTDIRDIGAGTAVLADALWTLGNEERVE